MVPNQKYLDSWDVCFHEMVRNPADEAFPCLSHLLFIFLSKSTLVSGTQQYVHIMVFGRHYSPETGLGIFTVTCISVM